MILILAGAVFMLVGGVAARYVWQTWSEYAAVNSEPFYFTADLLGDTEMTADADNGSYSFVSPKVAHGIFTAAKNTRLNSIFSITMIIFALRRMLLSIPLQWMQKDFNGVTLKDSTGNLLTGSQNLGEAPATEGAKYEQKSQKLILTIPADIPKTKRLRLRLRAASRIKRHWS